MMQNGLVDEVRRLREIGCRRDMVSMQGLGYKEILDFLDGKISLEEAVYRIKRTPATSPSGSSPGFAGNGMWSGLTEPPSTEMRKKFWHT